MALTRTEDKTDKAIIRLLLDNPMGLTIGDITAEAKCTPQTARKSLARIVAEKDASGMLYVLRDDDEQPEKAAQAEPEAEPTAPTQQPETMLENWGGITFLNPFADAHAPEPTDPAPAAVAEAPAAQPERTHAETTIRQFKPGDYVVPINTHVIYTAKMKRHLGRVLQVSVVHDGYYLSVRAGIPGEEAWWRWHPDDLRPATAKEIAAASTPEPELAAEVPLSGLQQRILTLLSQHRGLTAQRIADDLHAPLEGVQDALHDLSHLIASRPLMLPEIQVWEVVA